MAGQKESNHASGGAHACTQHRMQHGHAYKCIRKPPTDLLTLRSWQLVSLYDFQHQNGKPHANVAGMQIYHTALLCQ